MQRPPVRLLPIATAVLVLVGACNAFGGADGAQPTTLASPPVASADPGGGVSGTPSSGNASDLPLPVDPTPVDPGAGQPALVVPEPGRQDPHPVAPTLLQASVDGRHVLVKTSWYGGVAPCSVLDSVHVEKGPGTIALTVIEGSSDQTAVCPELAMLKATIVDLGELDPRPWTITAPGSDAAAIHLTIA
jgi:hypothetical protein